MPQPIRDVALVTNPSAGRGRAAAVRNAALPVLAAAGWNVRRLDARDRSEAEDLAAKAVADGVDALLVCGGDGMVNLGFQLVAGTTLPLGVLPAGRHDDLARTIGLPRGDGAAAARRLTNGRPQRLDLGRSGDRWFATVLTPFGSLRQTRRLPYVLTLDGEERMVEATMVAIANTPTFAGGKPIAPRALVDDGLLDVVIIRSIGRWELVQVRKVTVAAPGVVAHADGGRFGALPLTIECVPAAAWVIA
ncbi:MAG TPA: diacylglycerol kinase family protein [Nocardioides sp.]|nr:diacylglycerol kinase family protein [Nocardioides sp.]